MSSMVRSAGLRGYLTLMRELGADAAPLMRRQRISPTLLEQEDTLVPLANATALLESSAEASGCADFGLRLAALQDIGILGPLAFAMQHSKTVADALQLATRFLFVQSPALVLSLLPQTPRRGQLELRMEIRLPPGTPQRQVSDQCLGVLHLILRYFVPGRYAPEAVHLSHEPLAPLATYRRFFGGPVRARQSFAAIVIRADLLDEPLHDTDESLRQMAMSYIAQTYRDPGQPLAARVRLALTRTLSTTGGSKEVVAGMLGVHPRTLHRRLLAEGQQFETIRDDVRRELAARYLQQTRMSLTHIADIVGLSQQSALTRACKRWFGRTPSQVREASVVQ